MFCALKDLVTESDVEQKLLWPLLTTPFPTGLGLIPSDVLTKMSIRRLEVGKGTSRKLYFPDYMVVIAGLPVLVVEAKAPGEDLQMALGEARLYGNELNALFPSGTNPCARVVASNGSELWSSPLDTNDPDIRLKHADLSIAHPEFSRLLDLCQRAALQDHADGIRRRFRRPHYRRAVSLIGGTTFQNEELAPNTFGATIVGDYGHVFSPRSKQDRETVVRHAYIPSLRRQRYVEPIDRLIRSAVAPGTAAVRLFENTGDPNLIDVAQDLFVKRGYAATTVEAIAEAAGMSKRTFFRYFATKDELVVGKYDDMIEALVAALESRPADEPLWTSLRRMFDFVVSYSENPALARRMSVMDGVIETSEALRAAYLERWRRAELRLVAVARSRAAAQRRAWSDRDPGPRAMIGAAIACLESAREVAARTGEPLGPLLDAAMNALTPLTEVGSHRHRRRDRPA